MEGMRPGRIVIEPTGLANLPDMLGVVEGGRTAPALPAQLGHLGRGRLLCGGDA